MASINNPVNMDNAHPSWAGKKEDRILFGLVTLCCLSTLAFAAIVAWPKYGLNWESVGIPLGVCGTPVLAMMTLYGVCLIRHGHNARIQDVFKKNCRVNLNDDQKGL